MIRVGVRPELIPTPEDFSKALDVAEERLSKHEESPFMTLEGLRQYHYELADALACLPFDGDGIDALEARYDRVARRIAGACADIERREES